MSPSGLGRFDGRVVLVTGGTGGLGRACALRLADEGATVVVVGRRARACAEVVAEVESRGGHAMAMPADVTSRTEVEHVVNRTIEAFGRLNAAINNAGVSPAPIAAVNCSDDVWDAAFELNARAVFRCMRAELSHMVPAGRGAIVNVASYAAEVVQVPGIAAYAASKHAVVGMTRAAARDHARSGVRVNALGPGHMRTSMIDRNLSDGGEERLAARIPMGRVSEPTEVAAVAAFLLSDDASFITGQLLVADGGLSI